MTEQLWYYVNAQQEKIGPVAASVIKEAFVRGELRRDSLVWQPALPQWQSLADNARAFDIDFSNANVAWLNGTEVKYANFFHRWAAFIFDQWLVTFISLLTVGSICAAIYFLGDFSGKDNIDAAMILLFGGIFAYIFMLMLTSGIYHISFESSAKQGSYGKQYLGLMVTDDKGAPIDRQKAMLRWFSTALSHMSQNIGFLMAAFTQKRQALHDFLANTLVLERKPVAPAPDINRNQRAVVVLLVGLLVMPVLLVGLFMGPIFYFIAEQEKAEAAEHAKIAALVPAIQKAMYQREAADQTCLSHDEPEIAPLVAPLKALTTEVITGLSYDEEACEIYIGYGVGETVSYRSDGSGGWTCEASENPEHFAKDCKLLYENSFSGSD
jgi:uncharacterized RDD family membrane protein YckC